MNCAIQIGERSIIFVNSEHHFLQGESAGKIKSQKFLAFRFEPVIGTRNIDITIDCPSGFIQGNLVIPTKPLFRMNISLEFKGKIGVVKVVNPTVQGKVVATTSAASDSMIREVVTGLNSPPFEYVPFRFRFLTEKGSMSQDKFALEV